MVIGERLDGTSVTLSSDDFYITGDLYMGEGASKTKTDLIFHYNNGDNHKTIPVGLKLDVDVNALKTSYSDTNTFQAFDKYALDPGVLQLYFTSSDNNIDLTDIWNRITIDYGTDSTGEKLDHLVAGSRVIHLIYKEGENSFTFTVNVNVTPAYVEIPTWNGQLVDQYVGSDITKTIVSDYVIVQNGQTSDDALISVSFSNITSPTIESSGDGTMITLVEKDRGTYLVTFSLTDPTNYQWSFGSNSQATIDESGNAVYTTNVIVPSKIPLEKSSEGREYRVINFTKIPNDKDLYEYGFAKGTKKEDIRLLVHMIGDEVDLNRMRYLSDINNAGVLSETLISLDKQRTYCNRNYGVVLSNMPYNVIQMSDENIGSGTKKDFKYAIRAAQTGLHRDEFKKLLLAELGLEGKVSDDEYAEFYLKYLSNKNMLSQFSADREYKIGAYAVSSDVLRAAAARVMDGFIERSAEADTHSEFVAYNPKIRAIIAKENSLDDTPQYLKDYAFEHNLPIFLTGKP